MQIPCHCTHIFKNGDSTTYISKQILYKICKASHIDAILTRYAVKSFGRDLSHPNPVFAEYPEIDISEENLLRSNQFPQVLLSYKCDNRLFGKEGDVVLYRGHHSHAPPNSIPSIIPFPSIPSPLLPQPYFRIYQ